MFDSLLEVITIGPSDIFWLSEITWIIEVTQANTDVSSDFDCAINDCWKNNFGPPNILVCQ